MIFEQVTERTYANTSGEGIGNFGAICLQNYVVAIDAGMFPPFAKIFRTDIERAVRKPVTNLVLTHYHGDHVFGNQVFKDCQIISSRTLAARMHEAAISEWTRAKLEEIAKTRPDSFGKLDLDKIEITFPTRVFDTSLTLRDGGFEIVIKKVGGHTSCSSYVFFPNDRVLFAGDLIFAGTFPWGGDPTADPDKWIAVLKKFQQMDIAKIIPGHGPVCDLKEVKTYLDFFEPVTKIMKELITEGKTQEEIVGFDGYPELYAPANPERRKDTFTQWYNTYKKKLGK